eukprot:9499846-Pyramimonas_sp.AAC.2
MARLMCHGELSGVFTGSIAAFRRSETGATATRRQRNASARGGSYATFQVPMMSISNGMPSRARKDGTDRSDVAEVRTALRSQQQRAETRVAPLTTQSAKSKANEVSVRRAGKAGKSRGNRSKKKSRTNEEESAGGVFADDDDGYLDSAEMMWDRQMDGVIKVYCIHTEPNYSMPWQRRRQYQSTSTGFVIDVERKRLLTNAHSVEHHTQVLTREPDG